MEVHVRKVRRWSPIKGKILLFCVFLFFVSTIALYGGKTLLLPIDTVGQGVQKVVEIPEGTTVNTIGNILYDEGLIRNGVAFRFYMKYNHLDSKIKAGKYHLSSTMSVKQIGAKLIKGENAYIAFTVPEGFTTAQIANRLAEKGLIDKEKFMDLVAHGKFQFSFLEGLPEGPNRLEGYLFPDTYKVTDKTTEEQIITMMLKRFESELPTDFEAKAKAQGLTAHQAVILASIIEREAKKDDERPKVSAVFLNRLKKHWKLESCATVQYILGKPKARLFNKDLEIDSPYNTYKNFGLPIGPISSPGKPSLNAAVNPAKMDAMFFVVFEDGRHIFSKTLAEHNKAKAAYLKKIK